MKCPDVATPHNLMDVTTAKQPIRLGDGGEKRLTGVAVHMGRSISETHVDVRTPISAELSGSLRDKRGVVRLFGNPQNTIDLDDSESTFMGGIPWPGPKGWKQAGGVLSPRGSNHVRPDRILAPMIANTRAAITNYSGPRNLDHRTRLWPDVFPPGVPDRPAN